MVWGGRRFLTLESKLIRAKHHFTLGRSQPARREPRALHHEAGGVAGGLGDLGQLREKRRAAHELPIAVADELYMPLAHHLRRVAPLRQNRHDLASAVSHTPAHGSRWLRQERCGGLHCISCISTWEDLIDG